MLETVKNAFRIKDIRNKVLFTLLMLVVVRLGSQLPVPGTDRGYFAQWFAKNSLAGCPFPAVFNKRIW